MSMRVSGVKKMLAWLVCAALCLTGLAGAGAESATTLSVDLRGLTATAEGRWISAPLTGEFEVYSGDTSLGRVTANPADGSADVLTLTATEQITLAPVAGTFSAGYLMPSGRVAVSVTAARRNDPAVLLYADAGLFTVSGAAGSTFTVSNAAGQEAAAFTLDESGVFALPTAIASGTYTLTQTSAPEGLLCMAPQRFELTAYTGKAEQIVALTAEALTAPTGGEQLGTLHAETAGGAEPLSTGAQELTGNIGGICAGENPWALDGATLTLSGLTLRDRAGQALEDGAAALASLMWTGETAPEAAFLDALGQVLGTATLVSGQGVAAPAGAAAVKLDYGAVPAGFDGGVVVVTVRAEARSESQTAARSLTMETAFDWTVQNVAAHQTAQAAWHIAGNGATLTGELVQEGAAAALNLTSNQMEVLGSCKAVLVLPAGWQASTGAWRTSSADVIALEGIAAETSFPVAAAAQAAEAAVYVLQDPASPVLEDAQLVTSALADAILNEQGGVYGKITVAVRTGTMPETAAETWETRTLTVTAFDDENGDGAQGAGETAAQGVAVRVLGGAMNYAAVTGEDGRAVITGIPAQEGLTASLTLPRGATAAGLTALADGTYSAALPAEGDAALTVACTVPCTVSGHVTVGGAGVAGAAVTLGTGTVLTDESGAYAFENLVPGNYTVIFQDDSGRYAFAPDQAERTVQVGAETAKQVTVDAEATLLGSLRVTLTGDSTEATCTLLREGAVAAEGVVSGGEAVFTGLQTGEYTVLAALPEGFAMTALNGYENVSRGQVQWLATITGGMESRYELTLGRTGGVSCAVSGIPDGSVVTFVGDADGAEATISGGSFSVSALCPGSYTVTLPLAEGMTVAGENWETVEEGGAAFARTTIAVQGGMVSAIPGLATVRESTLAGVVFRDANGDGIRDAAETGVQGLKVTLLSENGTTVASAQTDESGAWAMGGLHAGMYSLAVTLEDGMALLGKTGECVIGAGGQSDAFALGAGEALENLNAAVVEPGRLETNVFIDANSNGEKGTYERMLAGATIAVIRVTDAGETIVATATSDELGEADFAQLAPGTYKLRVTLPAGYAFGKKGADLRSTSSIMEQSIELIEDSQTFAVEASGTTRLGIGVNTMASVTGRAWLDANADGIMQSDEGGQSGVLVTLTGVKNGREYTTTTDADGQYVLSQVWPGTYKLSFTCPDGLMFTKYSATGRENRSIITVEGKRTGSKEVVLEAGDLLDLQYVGVVHEATITGVAFLDANYNGLYDEGEETLSGVSCELLKSLSGKTVATVTTGEDGRFTFVALRENTYRLRAVLPNTGVTFTLAVASSVEGNWFKAREGRREYSVDDISVKTGETRSLVIGAIMPGVISGTVYLDDDFSATKNGSEKAAAGLTVKLMDADGNVVDQVNSSNKGTYKFTGIVPGTYRLAMTARNGYAFTKLGEGNVMVNAGGGQGLSDAFTVALGEEKTGMDAGMILPGTVQGAVFADLNDNGTQDEGENGLAGTVVKLMDEDGAAFETTVGENGAYLFDAVMPGRYYVRYELPEDSIFAQVVSGGNAVTGEGETGASEWFSFKTADKVDMPLCGGVTLGLVRGAAFEDLDGSGTQDAGEGRLAGVTVTLTPSRSDLEPLSATTDASGAFTLAAVHPDTYTLTVGVPEGMVLSRTAGTTLPVKAGAREQSVALSIPMGERYDAQLLGAVRPGSVSGILWMDESNDGVKDAGEQTPAGRTITVVDEADDSVYATLTTGSDGAFAATGLIPGSYTFRYELDSASVAAKAGDSTFRDAAGALEQSGVRVNSDDAVVGLKCGYVRYTTLGGTVWVDENGAFGTLGGATVSLINSQGAAVQTVLTGEDGAFSFGQLLPGSYYLTASLPEGYLVVDPGDDRLADGAHMSTMTQANGRTGQSGELTVRMGEDQTTLDVGAVLPGKLGDQAWLDLDGDGWQESGEPGLPGVTVQLLRGGEVVAETTTDAYGYYLFENVYPSSYTLEVTYPAEVKPTRRVDGAYLVSVLEETDETTATASGVRVESDRSNFSADLGFQLRQAGVYPAGVGEAPTQNWTR